jgi:hypothetical protein
MVFAYTLTAAARMARQLSLATAVLLAAAATAFAQQDEAPEDYPAGAGRDDTFYACSACHGFKLVAQQGMNRRQWNESLDLMVSKHGMSEPDAADRKTILDYLEATFPPRTTPARGGFQNPFTQ